MFLVHLLHLAADGVALGFQLLDGRLFGGEVAGDDQRRSGIEVGVLGFAVRCTAWSSPRCDDQVDVVLHRLGPVVHQVLIDVVGVEQRRVRERCPAGPRRASRSAPWAGRRLRCLSSAARCAFRHSAKSCVTGCVEGGELGVAEDGGLDLGRPATFELAVAGPAGRLEQSRAHGGEDLPVALERVDVAVGDAAAQVARRCPASPPARCCRCSAGG